MAFSAFPGVEPLEAEVLQALITEVRPLGAVKSAIQTVTNATGTTLVNVTGMSVALAANAVYLADFDLYYNSGATPDIKFGLTLPAGATGSWGGLGYDFTPVLLAFGPIDIGTSLAFGGLAADRAAIIKAAITTSSTAGTAQLQFAQSTSNASNTSILAGSRMLFRRIA